MAIIIEQSQRLDFKAHKGELLDINYIITDSAGPVDISLMVPEFRIYDSGGNFATITLTDGIAQVTNSWRVTRSGNLNNFDALLTYKLIVDGTEWFHGNLDYRPTSATIQDSYQVDVNLTGDVNINVALGSVTAGAGGGTAVTTENVTTAYEANADVVRFTTTKDAKLNGTASKTELDTLATSVSEDFVAQGTVNADLRAEIEAIKKHVGMGTVTDTTPVTAYPLAATEGLTETKRWVAPGSSSIFYSGVTTFMTFEHTIRLTTPTDGVMFMAGSLTVGLNGDYLVFRVGNLSSIDDTENQQEIFIRYYHPNVWNQSLKMTYYAEEANNGKMAELRLAVNDLWVSHNTNGFITNFYSADNVGYGAIQGTVGGGIPATVATGVTYESDMVLYAGQKPNFN